MAELGAVGSILQVPDVGLRLSTTLFTFAETVVSADKIVSAVSKDVSLTSSVLRELAKILDKADRDEAFSDGALDSALAIVKECSDVFAEIDRMLIEKLPKLSSQRKEKAPTVTMALERFKWPYLQSKMNLLQSNLERLKSSLLVILHVISLARMMGSTFADMTN
ncbi:hypothetical protein G7Y79_00013g034160 [Physcia stellaris]|nr:hypothetical protein G7Y79_00013g034160 [Physcia stellaris]